MYIFLFVFWLQVACDIKVVVNESLIYISILTIVAFTIERCDW